MLAIALLPVLLNVKNNNRTTASLAVGIGMESLGSTDFDKIRKNFDSAGVSEFSLAVGRGEWVAFPWEDHSDVWSGLAERADDEGTDPVAEALTALTDGTERQFTLTIDVLSPSAIEEDSDNAGRFADGRSSDSFPSATALHDGDVGEQIVELCRAASERYSPDRIALTELMGDAFFSEVDEELFSDMTGEDGFTRTDDGDIDTSDETVQQWQSEIVTGLISRCRSAANTEVEIDARVNWGEPGADRADSGHRYDDLLDAADHVTLWAYTGLQEDSKPKDTAKLVDALRKRYSFNKLSDFTISVGLWTFSDDEDDAVYSPKDTAKAAKAARKGPSSVLVTPLSMMTQEHWDELESVDFVDPATNSD